MVVQRSMENQMKRVTLKATIDVPSSWTVEQTRRYVERQLLPSVREIKTLELVPQLDEMVYDTLTAPLKRRTR